ncbi:hypothetical protein BDA96_02G082900 [Sorghum bicolor]|uniref:Uncharacterized protein n=1 Tax=Sorghum bicolor TaxID=4558 RepID=A0A921UUJ9_SORBI|nr:hypothetical protein BDA96_02G082900 [Sorghum bicolor]
MVPGFAVYDIEDPHDIFFLVAIDKLNHGKWSCHRGAVRTDGRGRREPLPTVHASRGAEGRAGGREGEPRYATVPGSCPPSAGESAGEGRRRWARCPPGRVTMRADAGEGEA